MTKKVRDYMSTFVSVPLGTRITSLIDDMVKAKARVAVCLDINGDVKGVVTGTDIIRELEHDIQSPRILQGTVDAIMSTEIQYVIDDAIMYEVVRRMHRHHLQMVVVTHGFKAVGIVQQTDVLRWWNDEIKVEDQKS